MAETHHPLRIACKNCGSPVGFDIVRQTYRCVHCGELSGIQEVKDHIYQWRELEKSNNKERRKGQNLEGTAFNTSGQLDNQVLNEMGPQEVFWDGYHFQYGAAWYIMAGAAALLYLTKGVRKDLYDHPLLYEILPNGKKVTMFSMIKEMGAVGVFLFGAVLVILLVSTYVILM